MMTAMEVGQKLVALMSEGKYEQIYTELYSPDILSVEAMDGPMKECKGMDAVNAKNEWWGNTFEPTRMEIDGPWPHGDQFILTFDMTTREKATGKENSMKEAALYTVKNGKIVEEHFFYSN